MDAELSGILTNWKAEVSRFIEDPFGSSLGRLLGERGVTRPVLRKVRGPCGVKTVLGCGDQPEECFSAIQYSDGSIYVGGTRNGLRHGRGVRTYAGVPVLYEGEYAMGMKQGQGKLLKLDGTGVIYEGGWLMEKKHGFGKLYSPSAAYEGEFLDDKFHGKGKLRWNGGDFYEGDFVAGSRTGKGKLWLNNGDFYEGGFLDSLYHGTGRYCWAGGTSLGGNFNRGTFEGPGTVCEAAPPLRPKQSEPLCDRSASSTALESFEFEFDFDEINAANNLL